MLTKLVIHVGKERKCHRTAIKRNIDLQQIYVLPVHMTNIKASARFDVSTFWRCFINNEAPVHFNEQNNKRQNGFIELYKK